LWVRRNCSVSPFEEYIFLLFLEKKVCSTIKQKKKIHSTSQVGWKRSLWFLPSSYYCYSAF
jgi:hypothetical protein